MAYTNFTKCTRAEYEQVIYGQDYDHKIKIYFNGTELQNADRYCEKFSVKPRIIPNGAKTFSLNNFVSKEAELILHNIDSSVIQDQVSISIGTYIDSAEDYEYVPIGIFNIQDTPTTDKNKITIKLRDNSVKFDFGYNAKTLIDNNYIQTTDTEYQYNKEYYTYDSQNEEYILLVKGTDYNVGDTITGTVYIKPMTVTKLQIFNDICSQAGVLTDITTFSGASDVLGIYDNKITARTYIANLAEQAGKIAAIDREGKLIFVDLLNLTTWNIPLRVVESYEIGTSFKIGKVVYEDAINRYETPDTIYDTLYLDSSNQYITGQTVNNVLTSTNGFEIVSMKTGKILGNPAIDGYDLISITDGDNIYTTLATHELTYTGTMLQLFDTQISALLKEKNVTINSEPTFQRWAKTNIDNVTAEVSITTGKVTTIENTVNNNYNEIIGRFGNYAPKSDLITIEESVTQLQTNTYTKTEINTKLTDGSVTKVSTTAGTFDENGMTIEKTNAKTKGNFNEKGVTVIDATGSTNTELLFAGYDEKLNETIVRTKNINVTKYLTLGTNSRIEDYVDTEYNDCTGVFWIGD